MNSKAISYALISMALYGAQHVLVKDATHAIADPLLVVLYAAAASLLAAAGILLFRKTRLEFVKIVASRSNWPLIAVVMTAGALSAVFYYIGIERTPVSIVSAILNTSVFWGAAFAWLFHRQRPSKWFPPCLFLVACGLAIQIQLPSKVNATDPAIDFAYASLLFLVPALYVLRPYLSDKQLPNNDPIAVSLASTVPYGPIAVAVLLLLVLQSPERVASSVSRASVSAHIAFVSGVCCVTLALAVFQKAIASTDNKAAPALFYGLIPSFTLLLGFMFHWVSTATGLAFARQVQPTSEQVGGGILVTAGLLAYAALPKLLAARR